MTVPKEALLGDHQGAEYGSILVPIFGTSLDDDIVQTAALLVAGEQTDEAAIDPATIEALPDSASSSSPMRAARRNRCASKPPRNRYGVVEAGGSLLHFSFG